MAMGVITIKNMYVCTTTSRIISSTMQVVMERGMVMSKVVTSPTRETLAKWSATIARSQGTIHGAALKEDWSGKLQWY
jgi:hypothetical protein